VQPGYRERSRAAENLALLDARTAIGDERYLELQRFNPADVANYATARETTGPFRFGGVDGYKRVYEAV
jgi:hydroxymethylglutaryl-CoA synthase